MKPRNIIHRPALALVPALALLVAGCSSKSAETENHETDPAPSDAAEQIAQDDASDRIADFTVQQVNGFDAFTLSDARGEWVTLHFLLKTECPICLRTTRTYAERADEALGMRQIFLKPDDPDDTTGWLSKYRPGEKGVPAVYRDENAQLAERFGIPDGYAFHGETVHYPALIIIDPLGREVFRKVGTSTIDRMDFDDYLAKLDELQRG